jgi:hypothetical protein
MMTTTSRASDSRKMRMVDGFIFAVFVAGLVVTTVGFWLLTPAAGLIFVGTALVSAALSYSRSGSSS